MAFILIFIPLQNTYIFIIYMNRKTLIGFIFASIWLVTNSCTDNENKEFSSQIYNISGKVEKGPFISGSTIDLQPLDASMHALGTTYSSTISDHSGKFSFESKELDVPFAQLTANGYFFNEVNGDLSKGTITLRAVVNLTNQSTINVNLLTHLKYHRILNLIKKGKSFDEANSQSQQELLTAFGLQRFADTDVSQYSIASGTDEAGALIAISSLLIVDKTEAELTEYLARLSEEFGQNGIFSEITKQQFKQDRNSLSSRLSNIENYIISRYNEKLNMAVSVKDLSYFFDWDDDGIAGNEITDDNNPVTLEKSEINVPKEGGRYSIHINSSVPVSLTTNKVEADYPLDQYYKLYRTGSISHEEKLENQTLNIVIQPASNKRMDPTNIYIYDYRGTVVATLAVKQEGNPAGKLFTDDGEAIIANIASCFSQAIGMCNQMDARYTGQIIDQYFMPPVSYTNTNLNKCWSDLYRAINQNITLLSIDKNQGELLQAPLNTLNALCYYNLISYWGDVPYRTIENSSNFFLPRISTNTILTSLTTNLKKAITDLPDKKNIFGTNAEDFIFFSKDLPMIVLANIYMYQGNYKEAKILLNTLVSNGYYQLENTTEYSSDSKDLIFGLYSVNDGSRNTSTIIPILTYTDVILSLAECELNLGNEDSSENYLRSVANKKGINISTNLKDGIKIVRKQVLQQCGGYFAFLKRNGIAISELDLKDYQLLLPIPNDELSTNSSISQNPGY